MNQVKRVLLRLLFLILSTSYLSVLYALDLNDFVSLEATLTGVAQHADFDDVNDEDGNQVNDTSRGAVSVDVGVNFHPTDNDEFQITYSFAEGEAINGLEAFTLAPFADDLEEDLSDINSSNRYNLLEAWYKHTFPFSDSNSLAITLGIIGSTGYIDDNEYANDEVSQFMNDIFVNNTLANLPDYDSGSAIELNVGAWTMKGVVMNSENDDDNHYNYYAVQIGRHITNALGDGNYRIYGFRTDKEFLDASETSRERLSGLGVSIDQQLNETVGVFVRASTQSDDAAIDHDELLSVGLNIMGTHWNRPQDSVGVGVGYLDGAKDSGIDDTVAAEAYYRYLLTENVDLSVDAQWIKDSIENDSNPEGMLVGVRINLSI